MVCVWKQILPTTHSLYPSGNSDSSVHDHVFLITHWLCTYLESCPINKVLHKSHLSLENMMYTNKPDSKTRNIYFLSCMPVWSSCLLLTEGHLGLLHLQNCHEDLHSCWRNMVANRKYMKSYGFFFFFSHVQQLGGHNANHWLNVMYKLCDNIMRAFAIN